MIIAGLSWVAVGMLLVTSSGLLLSRDWRWRVGWLAAQYLGAAWLVGQHWPLGLAAAKLVAGWMATATLAMTFGEQFASAGNKEAPEEGSHALQSLLIGMIVVLTASIAPRIENTFPGMGLPVVAGGVLLCGIGLLQIGASSQVERLVPGLLTVLAGFEILYAAVEGSVLVAALLATINLSLALVGAYLLTKQEAV